MEYRDVKVNYPSSSQIQQPVKPPVQTLPTNDVDKVKLLSQIILRESPIQHDQPLLPQLIDRQRLLRSLISGPSTSTSSSSPLGISLNQNLPLIPPQEALISLPTSTSAEFVVIPSTSCPEQSVMYASQLPQSLPVQSTSQAFTQSRESQEHPQQEQQQPQQQSTLLGSQQSIPDYDLPIDVVHVETTSDRSTPSDTTQSRKRKLSSESASTCSAMEISTSPHLFEISEKNFTEVFTKQGTLDPLNHKQQVNVSNDRPNAQLISILNRCVTNMRNLLTQHGVSVAVDDNGMPVDYSSRPVDEIFKQSRKQLEMTRNFQTPKDKGS